MIGRPPKAIEVLKIGSCWVQRSHKLNQDSYFRKQYYKDDKRAVMFHRLMWEHVNNRTIPDGYDVDHLCVNRACFNPDHLRLYRHGDHQADSNSKRYRLGKYRSIKRQGI